MNDAKKLRNAIKSQFPNLKFKIRTVKMPDIHKEELWVTSDEWGIGIGNGELYHQVRIVAERYNASVEW